MTKALAALLGEGVHIEITNIVRTDTAVTSLEIHASLDAEPEETMFAIG